MAKKQTKKGVTIDELAMMVQRGFQGMDERFQSIDKRFQGVDKRFQNVEERFQSMENEMREGFQDVDERFQSMENKMQEGFTRLDASLGRYGRRVEYHDDEIIEIKGRLQAVEKKVGIKSRRSPI